MNIRTDLEFPEPLTEEDKARIYENGERLLGGRTNGFVELVPIDGNDRKYRLTMVTKE